MLDWTVCGRHLWYPYCSVSALNLLILLITRRLSANPVNAIAFANDRHRNQRLAAVLHDKAGATVTTQQESIRLLGQVVADTVIEVGVDKPSL